VLFGGISLTLVILVADGRGAYGELISVWVALMYVLGYVKKIEWSANDAGANCKRTHDDSAALSSCVQGTVP
jgi:hypothetical protein